MEATSYMAALLGRFHRHCEREAEKESDRLASRAAAAAENDAYVSALRLRSPEEDA